MAAMAPFVEAFDAFHARTASSDWLEGLVTAYVGDGLAADFYTEIAAFLDADTRTVDRGEPPRRRALGVRRRPGPRRDRSATTGSPAGWRCGAGG